MRRLSLSLLALALLPTFAYPQETPSEAGRKRAAVTLNYCLAALSRIRRYPSKRVLVEEQERILNNLDLNTIDDEEVISLYTALLDEISQTQIVDYERRVIHEQTRRGMERKLGANLFVIGAQVATGQLGSAIQSGANSWWDYRSTVMDRDVRTWAVERTRLTGIVSRSTKFLDAAWKLSRKKQIPDRWLVRTDDLIRLEQSLREPDKQKRVRVLARMERFMECYPPYWYYLARTQQQLGQLEDAAKTYRRLAELGDGHFRKDDMLAAGTANLAMIEEYLGQDTAPRTAMRALEYSTDAWEVNLTCAWILSRHQDYASAEDAILRNLDVDLEEDQSSIALVSLYYHNRDRSRLSEVLADPEVVARVPIPGLLLCATVLSEDQYPAAARRRVVASLRATPDVRFGRDTIALRTTPDWKLADAQIRMQIGERQLDPPQINTTQHGVEARFASAGDLGNPFRADTAGMVLTLEYPESPTIRVHLEPAPPGRNRISVPGVDLRSLEAAGGGGYRISVVEVGERRLTMKTADPERS